MNPSNRPTTLPPTVHIEPAAGGLSRVVVTNKFARAVVFIQGAHVTEFQPVGAAPVLFMSPRTQLAVGQAIRGGVPICWPWFGRAGNPAHGFARIRDWDFVEARQLPDDRTRLVFELRDDAETRELWPHAFITRYTMVVGASLDLELTTRNLGTQPFTFEDALHTYFAVADINTVELDGLSDIPFVDALDVPARQGNITGPMRFRAETCLIFQDDPAVAGIHDQAGKRRIVIAKSGARSTVVWTPWDKTAMAMTDLGDAWPGFLCVESANCREGAVRLSPGEEHSTSVVYTVEDIAAG